MALFADYEPERCGQPPPEGLIVRVATREVVEALTTLRVSRGDAEPAPARHHFHKLLWRVHDGEALCLVACTPDGVVAYGEASPYYHPAMPEGWYLTGLIVAADWRRRGIGDRLTSERLHWIAARAPRAYYFANSRNGATIDLHARFGFREIQRGLEGYGLTFAGGVGLLFALDFPSPGS